MTRLDEDVDLVQNGAVHPQDRDVSAIVGSNLKSLRRAQGYSLEKLADMSKVSRAMLGQIETGKSVPTITVLWKIADALQVPLGRLVHVEEAPLFRVFRRSDDASAPEGFQRRALFEPGIPGPSQLHELRLDPGHREIINSVEFGRHITIVVTAGSILVSVSSDASVHLREGDAIAFESRGLFTLENVAAGAAYALAITAQK